MILYHDLLWYDDAISRWKTGVFPPDYPCPLAEWEWVQDCSVYGGNEASFRDLMSKALGGFSLGML